MSDDWDSDCENALEDLCQEVANGDEARALLALLPALRASLAIAFKAGRLDCASEHPTNER